MNPQLFWIQATLRLSLILFGSAIFWLIFGSVIGLLAGMAGMAFLAVVQLFYLYRLGGWLDNPDSRRLPDGWGAWTDIFARLYGIGTGLSIVKHVLLRHGAVLAVASQPEQGSTFVARFEKSAVCDGITHH